MSPTTSPTTRRYPTVRLLLVTALLLGGVTAVVAPSTPARATVPDVQAQAQAAWVTATNRGERAAVAVFDRVTGKFWGAGDYDASYASASVVKVAIAVQLLVTGQMSGSTQTQAYSMITRSDDDAASALYGRVGGDGVMPAVAARYGLSSFFGRPTAAGWWGLTRITAEGIVRLYDKIAADPVVAPWLLAAMAATECTAKDGWPQCTGLPSVAAGWRVKQGWMCCLDNLTRMHSTGYVNGDRYTVALLTEGSRSVYGAYGRDTLTAMAQALLPGGYVVDPHLAYGWLDRVTAVGQNVTVGGWASDPDTPGTPVSVHVYLDGRFATQTSAGLDRPDVGAAGYPQRSGFLTTITAPADGRHTVCAYAIDSGGTGVNPQLNCLDVVVSGSAYGYFDGLTGDPTSTVVQGWALDPDDPSKPLAVQVYVDGVYAGAGRADRQRDDVVTATGLPGAHGFQFQVPTAKGIHSVCTYAVGTDARKAGLGCLTGGYDGTPSGVVEQMTSTATWLRLSGWVRDPDTSGPVPVDVWAGSTYLGTLSATAARTDIDAALGVTGSRGFEGTVTVPIGTSAVTAYAINIGAGNSNPALGTATITGRADPVGFLDALTPTANGVTVAGWAADPDLGAGAATVHVYVDGRFAATLQAGRARTDVNSLLGIPGAHGYVATVPAAAGTHQVCAYAINAGAGSVNTTLGCLSTSR